MRGLSVGELGAVALLVAANLWGIEPPKVAAAGRAHPGKPVVYNLVTAPGDEVDRLLHQIYDPTFHVVDILNGQGTFVPPAVTDAPPPEMPEDAGISIGGEVIVFFIISAAGEPTNPVIVRSSDGRLDAAVLAALAQWVFKPARVNGEKVASTAGQRFFFQPRHPWSSA